MILNGHVDVVPTGPPHLWTSAPFQASVREGRVFGRGSGDMKAGVVAMCMALKVLNDVVYRIGLMISRCWKSWIFNQQRVFTSCPCLMRNAQEMEPLHASHEVIAQMRA